MPGAATRACSSRQSLPPLICAQRRLGELYLTASRSCHSFRTTINCRVHARDAGSRFAAVVLDRIVCTG